MAIINDRHNPSFTLLPVNNNRTAWRPFGLPAVMVVPHRRTVNGDSISSSQAFNVKVYIEDVPKEARVAGHDHIGERLPNRELYAEYLSSLELADKFINIDDYTFNDANGNIIEKSEAQEGATFLFTTSSGIVDSIPYYQDADYYDLSDVLIDMELLPIDRYKLVYEAEYFARVVSQDELQEFLCIDVSRIAIARLKFDVNHPGEIINEFYNLTPPPYLTNASKSLDGTIALYRPFTDLLQDVYDEQDILENINWVFDTPPEAIPYISSLLGWELPYFPQSLDALRKAVLRRTVEFQNLSGSRRAIINVFRLFGFEILISNLWWSSDGKRFIRPGEKLPTSYEDQEIEIANICQIDLVYNNYTKAGFTQASIPLLFRPQVKATFGDFSAVRDGGDITLEAYLVTKGSEAHTALQEIAESIVADPENYGSNEGYFIDANGFINSTPIYNALKDLSVDGFSQILISGKLGLPTNEVLVGDPPITQKTVKFNRETNMLDMALNGFFDSKTQAIYIFANYERQKIVVPSIIEDLQSNRFDIQVLTQSFAEFADPTTLEFAIEFLNRLKAFHSLLNLIRTRIELTETYEVTDWCVGGDSIMRYDTDAGRLQVPPAIIPNIPGAIDDCTLLDPINLGYKENDLLLRLRKLANLPEEHQAWKALDDRPSSFSAGLSLSPMQPGEGRTQCKFTYQGQDRITGSREEQRDVEYGPSPNTSRQIAAHPENPRVSPNDIADNGVFETTGSPVSTNSNSNAYSSFNREYTKIRTPLCDDNSNSDFCYKGRIDDELLFRNALIETEHPRMKPCSIGMGTGLYYLYPAYSIVTVPGTKKPCSSSKTSSIRFSGKAKEGNRQHYLDSILNEYLSVDYDKPLNAKQNSHLGQLYRSYGTPTTQTLHYNNRRGMPILDQRHNLALERPSLVIEKPTMHLPGCAFVFMNRLENDFEHDTWKARPWDDIYSTYCGPENVCGNNDPSFLNAHFEEDTNGDEILVFDEEPFKILGNGLTPILRTFGGDSTDATDIVHAVYMESCNDSPYVTLDQVDELPPTMSDGFITTDDPLFNSHNMCGTDGYVDFADGYPSSRGAFDTPKSTFDEYFENWAEILDAIGLPRTLSSNNEISCKFGSGILDRSVQTLRFDCGCLLAGCDGTLSLDEGTICSADTFIDSDGNYDWEPDHLNVELKLKLEETIGTCSAQFNGSIPSFLEVI